jgi:hypothetical protein
MAGSEKLYHVLFLITADERRRELYASIWLSLLKPPVVIYIGAAAAEECMFVVGYPSESLTRVIGTAAARDTALSTNFSSGSSAQETTTSTLRTFFKNLDYSIGMGVDGRE